MLTSFTPAVIPQPTFKRVTVPQNNYIPYGLPTPPATDTNAGAAQQYASNFIPVTNGINCIACRSYHPIGKCPLKLAGVECCNLCGLAHFGSTRVCPHIQSETQVS